MIRGKGPYPEAAYEKRLAQCVMPPLMDVISGELTTSRVDRPLGAARFPGRVTAVWMSVKGCGRDDSNALQISGEVFINGTTCMTTKPSICANNGSAAAQKTTVVTGDTGIAQGVVDQTANTFEAGDVFTCAYTIKRTATPTTEIKGVVLVVELEPGD